jgi:small-conductance mechanosensitive channel
MTALAALHVFALIALTAAIWLLDRRAAARSERLSQALSVDLARILRDAAKLGSLSIATELEGRMGTLGQDQTEIREMLRRVEQRLGSYEASMGLLPGAMLSLRNLLNQKFEDREERQIPPEGQEIAASALSRIQTARQQAAKFEEESLKKLQDSIASGNREPLIRVMAGD